MGAGRRKGSRERDKKDYCDSQIKNINHDLLAKNKRMCRTCGKIKRIGDFEYRYDRHNADGSVTQVFSSVCSDCGGSKLGR